jgi:hypothetical protein
MLSNAPLPKTQELYIRLAGLYMSAALHFVYYYRKPVTRVLPHCRWVLNGEGEGVWVGLESISCFTNIQDIQKRCIHIIIRNTNLVYTSFWDTLYILCSTFVGNCLIFSYH